MTTAAFTFDQGQGERKRKAITSSIGQVMIASFYHFPLFAFRLIGHVERNGG